MYSALYQQHSHVHQVSARRRVIALTLVAIVHALIILLFLLQRSPPVPQHEDKPTLVTFRTLPEKAKAAKQKSKAKAKAREIKKADRAVTVPVPETPKTDVTPPPTAPSPLPFLVLSRKEFAAADISKQQPDHGERQAAAAAPASGGGNSSGDSSSEYGPGEGPGGEPLFDAEWYRPPTDAELAYYLPAHMPPNGWGLVACRTIEDYHVDNCRSLGESPPGSGLAQAVRRAAWQFRVLPPRIGGRPVIGAWVRIRIDYSQGKPKT